MHLIDLALMGLLALGFFSGMRSGLVRQVTGVVGGIACLLLAALLMPSFASVGSTYLSVPPRISPLVSFILLFAAGMTALHVITSVIEGVIKFLKLNSVNKLAGGMAGSLKIALATSALLFPFQLLNIPSTEVRTASMLYTPIAEVAPWVYQTVTVWLPASKDLQYRFEGALNRIDPEAQFAPEPP